MPGWRWTQLPTNLRPLAALFVSYVATAQLGLSLGATGGGFATMVWPPAGIALFALLRFGAGLWPAVFAGAVVANLLAGAPAAVALAIGLGNTVEVLLATDLLARARVRSDLSRVRDVAGLFLLAGLLSTAVAATSGTFALALGGVIGPGSFGRTWLAWFGGDALAVLTVAPVLLVWSRRRAWTQVGRRPLEAVATLAILLALSAGIFIVSWPSSPSSPHQFPYIIFPILYFAAFRFTQAGAAAGTALLSTISIAGTVLGGGPFVRETLAESLLLVQAFMAVSAMTALVIAAATSERNRARAASLSSGEASRFLAQASLQLGATLDVEASMRALARLATPRLGDRCTVDVLAPDGSRWQVTEAAARPGAPVEAPGAIFAVPLWSRGRALGSLTFAMASPARAFRADDLVLADELAGRAAVALDNALLFHAQVAASDAANQALRTRDEFLAVAGHELRTPLTALLLQVQGLQRSSLGGKVVPNLEARLARAAAAANRLEALIDQLLDVTRIAAGRLQLEPEPFCLDELARDVAERFAEQAQHAGCSVSVQALGRAAGTWDRLRVDQALSNLVANAIKYGRGKPIVVEVNEEAGQGVVRVIDRGIGIALQQQERIFERFERAVARREFGGLGLGLWITRQVAQACGGAIEVQSEPGQGSTFTLRLPLAQRGVSA